MKTLRTTVLPFAMLLGFLLAIVAMVHEQDITGHVSARLLITALIFAAAVIVWALSLGTEA